MRGSGAVWGIDPLARPLIRDRPGESPRVGSEPHDIGEAPILPGFSLPPRGPARLTRHLSRIWPRISPPG